MEIEERIINHFKTLDESLDILSLHQEGEITNLPSWVHTTRKIVVGVTNDGEGIALKITPDPEIESDEIIVENISSKSDVDSIIAPMNYGGNSLQDLDENSFMLMGDMKVTAGSNPLTIPALDSRYLVGFGRRKGLYEVFDENKAKQEAIDFWNKRILPKSDQHTSYVLEVRRVLERIQAIIKRKAFLERRVHRFINEHNKILLPNYNNCFYEHVLFRNGEKRKADFILERSLGSGLTNGH
jgi:hypothetical protein